MNVQSKQSITEIIGLIVVGALLLIIAIFFDPIGSTPDTGILDLGTKGTKWLLGILGAFFIAGGFGNFIKDTYSK